jgi:hypothetical protein
MGFSSIRARLRCIIGVRPWTSPMRSRPCDRSVGGTWPRVLMNHAGDVYIRRRLSIAPAMRATMGIKLIERDAHVSFKLITRAMITWKAAGSESKKQYGNQIFHFLLHLALQPLAIQFPRGARHSSTTIRATSSPNHSASSLMLTVNR